MYFDAPWAECDLGFAFRFESSDPCRTLTSFATAWLITAAGNLTEDITTLAEAFTWLPGLCVNTAIVLGCLVYLGWLSMTMLLVVISAIVVGVLWSFRIIERRALRGLSAARDMKTAPLAFSWEHLQPRARRGANSPAQRVQAFRSAVQTMDPGALVTTPVQAGLLTRGSTAWRSRSTGWIRSG